LNFKEHRMTVTSTAEVVTHRPDRFAKQLVSHFGRKVEWVTEGGASTASFGDATASVASREGVLLLTASAASLNQVAQIEDVLARHLQRFASKTPLQISWSRDTAEVAR
jgi:hypothetical protein